MRRACLVSSWFVYRLIFLLEYLGDEEGYASDDISAAESMPGVHCPLCVFRSFVFAGLVAQKHGDRGIRAMTSKTVCCRRSLFRSSYVWGAINLVFVCAIYRP